MKKLLVVCGLLALAGPAWAGFIVPIGLESAYNYDGSVCTATGAHALRTVPNCKGTGDGSFYVRYFTRVVGSAASFSVNQVDFVLRSASGTSVKNMCINVACTATTTSGTEVVTFNSGAGLNQLITYDIGSSGGAACTSGNECQYTGGVATPSINDMNTGAACSGTTCNNTELICKVSRYGGSGAGTCANPYTGANGEDFASITLTIGP